MSDKRLIDANPLRQKIEKWADLADNSISFTDSVESFAYDEVLDAIDAAPTIDPESLRPTAKWIVVRLMADGAERKCGNCGRRETFTAFDRHTDHVYCCRCGHKMEGAEK